MAVFEMKKQTNVVHCGPGEQKCTLLSCVICKLGSPNKDLVDTVAEVSVIADYTEC